MVMGSLRGATAIVGVAETGLGKGTKNALQLSADAAREAIEDAGLRKTDVDGLLTVTPVEVKQRFYASVLSEYLGLTPRYLNALEVGGATAATCVAHAAAAIAAGQCDTVLIIVGTARNSVWGRDKTVEALASVGHPEFEDPYGPLIPAMYALIASRHMHEYGTTHEQMAEVAVACRAHAALTPKALMRDPITVEDVLSSKPIAKPLHMLDCCLVSDYAGALIVTRADRAKSLRRPPVYVLGAGEGHTHEAISEAPNLTSFGCVTSGQVAFQTAGLGPKDVDVAELYDCFTITVLVELEDLGFCRKGEAGPFAASGALRLGGALPANTNGGLLSFANGGIFHITEATRQLRGECGARQVPGANVALAHNNGGIMSNHCTLVLGTEATL
ncbi:MAG: thiolase family protein [Chloroflexi bacterium]|nr:thiolase family protein [Chloroflexota bacterium]